MLTTIKKFLMIFTTVISCTYAGVLWAQETTKTEDDSSEEATAPLLGAAESERLPGRRPRLQYPGNNVSDKGQMEMLARQLADGLSPQLPEDALIWLETPTKDKFLVLWRPDRSGIPRGALLIVPSEGEHLAWPDTIRPLHNSLPDHGWATLAVSLPDPASPQIPGRTLPVKSQPDTRGEQSADNNDDLEISATSGLVIEDKPVVEVNQETQEDAQTTNNKQLAKPPDSSSPEVVTEQRLAAALDFLRDKDQSNIVILGSGAGAIRASKFLNNSMPKMDKPNVGATKRFSGIVLLNSRNRLPTMKRDYADWFVNSEIPVLDIFLGNDVRNLRAAKARKIIAKRKQMTRYKQVEINHLTATSVEQETVLSRRIRGYLGTNTSGENNGILQ
jgi:hypothetical protein